MSLSVMSGKGEEKVETMSQVYTTDKKRVYKQGVMF